MKKGGVIHIVANQCRLDQEEKFNKWYNEKHIPDLLKFKGLKKVMRYEILYPPTTYPNYPEVKYPKYLTIFEYDNQKGFEDYQASPELAEAGKDVKATWEKDPFERVWRVQYKLSRTWER